MYFYKPNFSPFLSVLYQDRDILVLDKQSGLLTVPGRPYSHRDSLQSRARAVFGSVGVVHRLDRGTSGVVVMALNANAHRLLGRQFENRQIHKNYIARVYGHVRQEQGSVTLPLLCDWPNRPRQKVDYQHGKEAVTHFQVLKREEQATRIKLQPVTGRSHQLRVHMDSLGHGIIGDRLYGGFDRCPVAERLQLHAASLTFAHPTTNSQMTFFAPQPF